MCAASEWNFLEVLLAAVAFVWPLPVCSASVWFVLEVLLATVAFESLFSVCSASVWFFEMLPAIVWLLDAASEWVDWAAYSYH